VVQKRRQKGTVSVDVHHVGYLCVINQQRVIQNPVVPLIDTLRLFDGQLMAYV